jgi:pilus assembly protein Flp/PilA
MNLFKRIKNYMDDKALRPLAWIKSQEGQGLVEYALILVLIAVVVILVLTGLGKKVSTVFSNVNSRMP